LSWEDWVIEQIIIFLNNNGIIYDGSYYFRVDDFSELDLILILNGEIGGFEIKLTSSPRRRDFERLRQTADLINTEKRLLLSK
jgi:hypothetical protein